MFEKLKKKPLRIAVDRELIDFTCFNDPVAMQTSWAPKKRGGSRSQTHKLVIIDSKRVEFKMPFGLKIFYFFIFLLGLGSLFFIDYSNISSVSFSCDSDEAESILVGPLLVLASGYMLYFGKAPIVFDKSINYFWKGRKSPKALSNIDSIKYHAKISDIHALQLIPEYIVRKGCCTGGTNFYSYELNLVFKNGERMNVVDHGNKKAIQKDAEQLSVWLSKPVWNAIGLFP